MQQPPGLRFWGCGAAGFSGLKLRLEGLGLRVAGFSVF